MKPEINWWAPIRLRSGAKENLIYTLDLDAVPSTAGVYVFARLIHGRVAPQYIGQASRLRRRIRGQLNNAKLMLGIKSEPGQRRVLLIGELQSKPGLQVSQALRVVESALIEYATLEGHDLLNIMGTKSRSHVITFWGSRESRSWITPGRGRRLTVRA